jgi:predicted esterase
MKNRLYFFAIIFILLNIKVLSEELTLKKVTINNNSIVSELIELLNNLVQNSDNSFFKQHCISIINVIEADNNLTANELSFIDSLYVTFSDTNVTWSAGELSSYLGRKRPFIVSWSSPTDSIVSLGWLLLPENWNSDETYPLYISLHGLYPPYENPIEYMIRYLSPNTTMERSFEDGYTFFPWGRGNKWYEGISETDIWEGMNVVENFVKVNPSRKYLMGHSMGGYGAWALGHKSPEKWAALGIYAGALWYGGNKYLNSETAEKLKDVPLYIVCGDQDGLLSNNQTAYQLLQEAGNTEVFFTTFNGGHESLLENWQNMYVWMKQFTNEDQTSVDMNDNTPLQFELYNNYPNPFNPATKIKFTIPLSPPLLKGEIPIHRDGGFVTLKVYDILGREVATLVNEEKPAGEYEVEFQSVVNGKQLAGGIYFYQLKVGRFTSTKKFVLMK